MEIYRRIIKLLCSDGRSLSGLFFSPEIKVRGAVLIAGATGIKKEFYGNFAEYLCRQGFAVLIFDFRGIGESKTKIIKQENASIIDWGTFDIPAALEQLKILVPKSKYHLIGHSAGGQLVGLMPNYSSLNSILNVASSTGKVSNMKGLFWLKAQFFMRIYLPLSNLIFGFGKTHWIGMGEPLPKKVGDQWCRWCLTDGYVRAGFGKEIQSHFYDQVSMPIKWVHSSDDPIANARSVQEIVDLHPNAKSEILKLEPSDYELKDIGHMRFFSRTNSKLWSIVIDWLERH